MRCLSALGVLALVPLAAAQSSVPPVLRKAIERAPHAVYSGRRIVEFKQGSEIQRHEEIIFRRGSQVRVEFPQGSRYTGQVIVESKDERRHFYPDRQEIEVMPPRREETLMRLVRLANDRKYRLATVAGEVVAGRRTQQVVVSDKDGNVVQRLFIDPVTGVLLKRRLFDRIGTPVGLFEFTTFNARPHLRDSLFVLQPRGVRLVTPADKLRTLAAEHRVPYWVLPPSSGFRLLHSRMMKSETPVLTQVYSSKKTRLSLFQMRGPVSRDRLRRFTRGDFNVKTWETSGWTLVLVGDVDASALGRLASQVTNGTRL